MTAPVRVQRGTIPHGDLGSLTTLAHMRNLVNAALQMPVVVETAHMIIRATAPRDYPAMARAIRDWMALNFKFVPDPLGVELTRTPAYMLNQYYAQGIVSGDCDDAATLGAALAKSVGMPCKLVGVGFGSWLGAFAHVYTIIALRSGVVVTLDVTKPAGNVAQIRRMLQYPV